MVITTPSFYAFTYKLNACKDHAQSVTREMYDKVLRHIHDEGVQIHSIYYELDSHQEYHIHGIAMHDVAPSFKKLAYKGYSSRWRKIYDYSGWERYCQKDMRSDDLDSEDDIGILKVSLFPKNPILES